MKKELGSRRTTRSTGNAKKKDDKEKAKPAAKTTKKKEGPEELTKTQKKALKDMGEDLIGSRAAICLDGNLDLLGKVPLSELQLTMKNLDNVHAVILDGDADAKIVELAEKKNIMFVICMNAKAKSKKISILELDKLE